MTRDTLSELVKILQDRKNADPKDSYVASLYKKGAPKMAQKLGEEAAETIIEAIRLDEKPKSKKRRENLKNEAADLLFHMQVLLSHFDITLDEIIDILGDRMGISGHDEKASRKKDF